jgi:hypothetical protein
MNDTNPIELKKSRDLGDIVQDSFRLITQNWQLLLQAVLLYAGPVYLAQGIVTGLWQYKLNATMQDKMGDFGGISDPSDLLDFYSQMLGSLFGVEYLLVLVIGLLGYGIVISLTYHFIKLYMENPGEPVSLDALRTAAFRDVFPLIGFLLAVYLITIVASMLCVIPGIYVSVPLSMLYFVYVYERKSLSDSIRRCFTLVKDYWWQTLGVVIVMAVLSILVPSIIIGIIVGVGKVISDGKMFTVVSSAITALVLLPFYTIFLTSLAFQYFNLVDRKEGGSSLSRIDEIGGLESPEEEETNPPL